MSYFPLTINFYVEYQHMTELSLIDHKAWDDIFFMFYIHRETTIGQCSLNICFIMLGAVTNYWFPYDSFRQAFCEIINQFQIHCLSTDKQNLSSVGSGQGSWAQSQEQTLCRGRLLLTPYRSWPAINTLSPNFSHFLSVQIGCFIRLEINCPQKFKLRLLSQPRSTDIEILYLKLGTSLTA